MKLNLKKRVIINNAVMKCTEYALGDNFPWPYVLLQNVSTLFAVKRTA